MARDSRFVTQMIFLEENGRPMEFYMKPCNLKKKLLPIIEIGGGTLTSKLPISETTIRLTDPNKTVEGYVSADFIFDSVKKQFLQDVNKYRCRTKRKRSDQEEEMERHQDSENDSDTINKKTKRIVNIVRYKELSDKEDNNKPHVKKKLKKKRLKYTNDDDEAILDYVEKMRGKMEYTVQGNSLWKHMASKKVTNHPWQSMRKHYLEFLHHKKRNKIKGQKTLAESYSKGKRMSSAQESESPRKKSKSSESHASRKEDFSDSDSDVDINLLTPRRKKENMSTNKQPKAVTRSQHKASSSNDETDKQPQGLKVILSRGRAITRSQQKTSDSNTDSEALNRQVMSRRQKRVIESGTSSGSQAVTKRQEENKVNEVSESELDNQSLPDNNFEECSQQVPQQEVPVYHKKDKSQQEKPVTKRRYPTRNSNNADSVNSLQRKDGTRNRVSDIDPEVHVTMATDQEDEDGIDSDVDEFDQRLLAIAEKASFSLSQESQDHDESSEEETSAKDTQEDDEDEFIFRRINRRKRGERRNNQNQKEKQAVTRQQSSTEKSSNLVQVNSTAQVNSKSKDVSSTPSKHESTSKSPSRQGKKTEITPETCSRNLFGGDDDNEDENEPTPRRTKGNSRKDVELTVAAQSPDEDKMWHFVNKISENYRKVERLPCTRGMTRAQLLHALYVSDGTLEDTENYIKTGKLANGASPWSKAENDAILSNERTTVNTIIKKRGLNTVSERGAFLRGCR